MPNFASACKNSSATTPTERQIRARARIAAFPIWDPESARLSETETARLAHDMHRRNRVMAPRPRSLLARERRSRPARWRRGCTRTPMIFSSMERLPCDQNRLTRTVIDSSIRVMRPRRPRRKSRTSTRFRRIVIPEARKGSPRHPARAIPLSIRRVLPVAGTMAIRISASMMPEGCSRRRP